MEFIHNHESFLRYIGQNAHCVNAIQSQDERRLKYKLLRAAGYEPYAAGMYRDWTRGHISRLAGYPSWADFLKSLAGEPKNRRLLKKAVKMWEIDLNPDI